MIRIRLIVFVSMMMVVWVSCTTVSADFFYLTTEGVRHLDEIQSAIAPVTLQTNARGERYFHGIAIDAHPASDRSASWNSNEGRAQWTVIAFAADGTARSRKPTRLSEHWIRVDQQWDTLLDMRILFSNRDKLINAELGSRRYRSSVMEAMYPGTSFSPVNSNDLQSSSDELIEGAMVHLMRTSATDRNDYTLLLNKHMVEQRRPGITFSYYAADMLSSGLHEFPEDLIRLVAQQRRYQLFEPRIDEVATSMLQALSGNLEGSVVKFEANGSPSKPSESISGLVRGALVGAIYSAKPGAVSNNDDQKVWQLVDQIRTPDNPQLEQIKTQLQQRLDHLREHPRDKSPLTFRAESGKRQRLQVDNSELASVAMDVISADDAWFNSAKRVEHDNRTGQLIQETRKNLLSVLIEYGSTPEYPDPRQLDRIALRGKAIALIVHWIDPPAAANSAAQDRRIILANSNRDILYRRLVGPTYDPNYGRSALIREALNTGGWVLTDEAKYTIKKAFKEAMGCSAHILDLTQRLSDPELRSDLRESFPVEIRNNSEQMSDRLQTLLDVYRLKDSPNEKHRQVADYLIPMFDKIRLEMEAGENSDVDWQREKVKPLRFFIDFWGALISD